MPITVRLFASIRRYQPQLAPGEKLSLEILPHATVSQILDRLGIPVRAAAITMVNGRVQRPDRVLSDEDVLSVFPPVAGG